MIKRILSKLFPPRTPDDAYISGAGWAFFQVRADGRHPRDVWLDVAYKRQGLAWTEGAYHVLADLLKLKEFNGDEN